MFVLMSTLAFADFVSWAGVHAIWNIKKKQNARAGFFFFAMLHTFAIYYNIGGEYIYIVRRGKI